MRFIHMYCAGCRNKEEMRFKLECQLSNDKEGIEELHCLSNSNFLNAYAEKANSNHQQYGESASVE